MMRSVVLVLAISSLTVGGLASPLASWADDAVVTQTDVKEALVGLPEVIGQSEDSQIKSDSDTAAAVRTNGTSIEVPKQPADGVTVSSEGATVSVIPPSADTAQKATEVSKGLVAYPSSDGSATAVQLVDGGSVRLLNVITSADSPTAYEYVVDVSKGLSLAMDPASGGVNVLNSQGQLVGTFAPPWAKDSQGSEVPTHYELDGSRLTQIVDHRSANFAYPVTADPWYGFRLIDRVQWVGSTLQVYPTTLGRYPWYTGWSWRWAAWSEVTGKAPSANRSNMADQFYCHWDLVRWRAPNKPSWNLDGNRPNVGYAETVRRLCNP